MTEAEQQLVAVRAQLDQAYAIYDQAAQNVRDLTVALIEISRNVFRPGSVTERLPVANEGHPGPGHA